MVFIRVDANEYIGVGHVMRCKSIAYSFVNHGEEVIFITADHKGDCIITDFSTICIDSVWNDLEQEINKLNILIQEYKPSLLLIDSYYVTNDYINALSGNVQTAYIDDLNTSTWNVDFLINYNIFSETFDYSKYLGSKTKLLLTPKYAPLRDEFRNIPEHKTKKVTDILVSAGGADPEQITEKIMETVCDRMQDICFHFVVGALNPRLEIIQKKVKKNIELHINEKNMSALMQRCDIAISAAGTTLYELCAAGIPTITYTLADNQIAAAQQFDKQGIMINIGDCREDDNFINKLYEALKYLINSPKKRTILSATMNKLIDGKGASRIVEALVE